MLDQNCLSEWHNLSEEEEKEQAQPVSPVSSRAILRCCTSLKPPSPCDARRPGDVSLPPLIKVCFSPWVGGTFQRSVSSELYPCKSSPLSPLCNCVQPVICEHCHGETRSGRSAAPMAHRGEIAGSLPHTHQVQVQRGPAEPEQPLQHTLPNIIKSDSPAK